eukprot:6492450-Amphidinium_carterae.5
MVVVVKVQQSASEDDTVHDLTFERQSNGKKLTFYNVLPFFTSQGCMKTKKREDTVAEHGRLRHAVKDDRIEPHSSKKSVCSWFGISWGSRFGAISFPALIQGGLATFCTVLYSLNTTETMENTNV